MVLLSCFALVNCPMSIPSYKSFDDSMAEGRRYNAEYNARIKYRDNCTDAEVGLTEELKKWAAGEAEARDPCYRPTPFVRNSATVDCERPVPMSPQYCPFPQQ